MGSKGKVVMYKQALFLLALVTFARSLPLPQGTTPAAEGADKAPPVEDAAGDGAEKAADAPAEGAPPEDAPPEEEVPEGGDTPPEEEVPEGGDTPAEKGAPEGGDKPEEVVEGAADGAKSEMGPAEDKIDEAITVMNKLNDLFEKIVNSLNDAAGDGESGDDVEEDLQQSLQQTVGQTWHLKKVRLQVTVGLKPGLHLQKGELERRMQLQHQHLQQMV